MQKHVTSYGIIPIHKDPSGQYLYLLLQSHGGHWGFPKGHPQPGENDIETAVREAKEEVGLKVAPGMLNFRVSYGYSEKRVDSVIKSKTVVLYPVLTNQKGVALQSKELKGYRWVRAGEAVQLINLAGVEEMMQEVKNWL